MKDYTVHYIPTEFIDADPEQPRKSHDRAALERLAETIRAHGIQQPIRIRRNGDRFTIVSGERRLLAARLAALAAVPCIIETGDAEASTRHIRQLLENTGREALRPLELAAAIEDLIAGGMTATAVAAQIGRSEGHISKIRKLRSGLAKPLQDAVSRGELSINDAYGLAKDKLGGSGDSVPPFEPQTLGVTSKELARKIRAAQRATTVPRRKVTLPLASGTSVAVSSVTLSLEALVAWLSDLIAKAQSALSQGQDIEAFAAALRPSKSARTGEAK